MSGKPEAQTAITHTQQNVLKVLSQISYYNGDQGQGVNEVGVCSDEI